MTTPSPSPSPPAIIIFSKDDQHMFHDFVNPRHRMVYAGQRSIYKNDKLFNVQESIKIYIFKQDRKKVWNFMGEGRVLEQCQSRVKHRHSPVLPMWVISMNIPRELSHWNAELARVRVNGYLHKRTVFEYIQRQNNMQPVYKNAVSVGIVELRKCL